MTDKKLKGIVAYTLLGAKMVVVIWVLMFWLSSSFDLWQMWDILSLIIPLFSVPLTVVLKHYFEEGENETVGKPIQSVIVNISLLVPIIYAIWMCFVVYLLAEVSGDSTQAQRTFMQRKVMLGMIGEGIFGIYLGIIIATLFNNKDY